MSGVVIPVRIHIQTASRGFVVTVPALPGLMAVGESENLAIAKARRLIRERLDQKQTDSAFMAGQERQIDLCGSTE